MATGIAAPWRRTIGRLGIQFREGEARPAILLFLMFFLLITFQYTTKSVRQSTFINSLGAEKLPWVYLWSPNSIFAHSKKLVGFKAPSYATHNMWNADEWTVGG